MHARNRTFAGLTVIAAASVALVLIPTGSAREVKLAETPATYTDATGDSKSAPDVSGALLDLDQASGALKLEVTFANNDDLSNSGSLLMAINADRNSGTGDRFGNDYVIGVFSDGMIFLKWNGSEMGLFNHQPTILARAPGKVLVVVCTCDLGTRAFDFVLAGLRGNDIDVMPENEPASFPPKTADAVSIESAFVVTKPLRPTAGKRFTVNVSGVRLGGTNELVLPDEASCSAKLAGRALKGSGAGGCSWLLPKKARGKKLTVSVNVSYHGDSETFSQTYKVR